MVADPTNCQEMEASFQGTYGCTGGSLRTDGQRSNQSSGKPAVGVILGSLDSLFISPKQLLVGASLEGPATPICTPAPLAATSPMSPFWREEWSLPLMGTKTTAAVETRKMLHNVLGRLKTPADFV